MTRRLMTAAGFLFAAGAAQGQELARPDPLMTPGAIDPNVTLADICTGTTKTRRHVSPATRAKVCETTTFRMPPASAWSSTTLFRWR